MQADNLQKYISGLISKTRNLRKKGNSEDIKSYNESIDEVVELLVKERNTVIDSYKNLKDRFL